MQANSVLTNVQDMDLVQEPQITYVHVILVGMDEIVLTKYVQPRVAKINSVI